MYMMSGLGVLIVPGWMIRRVALPLPLFFSMSLSSELSKTRRRTGWKANVARRGRRDPEHGGNVSWH